MPEMIVVARKDGRGGIKPFGKYGKKQAGALVNMGGKDYKVTKDGRVNIPKKYMEKYGVKGSDGRNRIAINFSSRPSTSKRGKASNHWKKIAAIISEPDSVSKDLKTGDSPLYDTADESGVRGELMPESEEDYIWS